MYFIGSGDATVQIGPGRCAELHKGDFFGEMALLEHRRHQHDVVAATQCRVYILDSEALARLSRHHPEIVRHIREVAQKRELENRRTRRTARASRAKAATKVNETEAQ
jgi:voltage-gated potassium channel